MQGNLPQTDKVALVTGGWSGIGRASALAFAGLGAKVVVADQDTVGGEQTAEQIYQLGQQAIFVKVDVTQPNEVEHLINLIIKQYGQLDYAHNNAGIQGKVAHLADSSEENWDQVINVNLKSVWLCLKYELAHMASRRQGAIVNTASVYGLRGSDRGISAYVASKYGIVGLTKTAALEYAKVGIRVNAVCPGAVCTPLREQLTGKNCLEEVHQNLNYPIGRIGVPEEIAQAVVWLCSQNSAFVTGTTLVLDGGVMAQNYL